MSVRIDGSEEARHSVAVVQGLADGLIAVESLPGRREPGAQVVQLAGRRPAVVAHVEPGRQIVEPRLQRIRLCRGVEAQPIEMAPVECIAFGEGHAAVVADGRIGVEHPVFLRLTETFPPFGELVRILGRPDTPGNRRRRWTPAQLPGHGSSAAESGCRSDDLGRHLPIHLQQPLQPDMQNAAQNPALPDAVGVGGGDAEVLAYGEPGCDGTIG